MRTTILSERRISGNKREGAVTLEEVMPDSEHWAAFKVKAVSIRYFRTEAAARAEYDKLTKPKRRNNGKNNQN